MLVTKEQEPVGKSLQIIIKYSPNVEMAASLHYLMTGGSVAHHQWAQHVLAALTDDDKQEAEALGALTGNWSLVMDLFCYLELINLTDTMTFLDDLARTDDVDVAYGLLSGMIEKKDLKVLLEDQKARDAWSDELVEQVFTKQFVRTTLEHCDETKRRIAAFLKRYWLCAFSRVWEEIGVGEMERADEERSALATVGQRAYLASCHPSLTVDDGGVYVTGDRVRNYRYSSLKAIDVYTTAFLTNELMLTRINRRLTIYKAIDVVVDELVVTPTQVFKFLKAISSETKMRILYELRKGPKTTKELSETLDMAPSTISVHLKAMRDAELIYPQRVQNAVYNRFLVENYKAFLRFLEDYLG